MKLNYWAGIIVGCESESSEEECRILCQRLAIHNAHFQLGCSLPPGQGQTMWPKKSSGAGKVSNQTPYTVKGESPKEPKFHANFLVCPLEFQTDLSHRITLEVMSKYSLSELKKAGWSLCYNVFVEETSFSLVVLWSCSLGCNVWKNFLWRYPYLLFVNEYIRYVLIGLFFYCMRRDVIQRFGN